MKPNHKQRITGSLVGFFLTFVFLCARNIYLNWPGPGERGYEEIQVVLALSEGPTVKLVGLGLFGGLLVLAAIRVITPKAAK